MYGKRNKLRKFKVSSTVYEKLEAAGCAICGSVKNLHLDHNHKDNTFRGVLCVNCNTGIGSFRDDPTLLLKAASYLESSSRKIEEVTHAD